MSDHAIISPSGFYKIELCRGSLAMEHGLQDSSSYAADQGSAAHDLASRVLQDTVDNGDEARAADTYLGDEIEIGERTFTVDEEMAQSVQEFVDLVMSLAGPGADILVEQKLIHGPLMGVTKEQGFGRGDAVILDYATDTIIVVDLKYGKGIKVFAKQNSQCKSYGLGAYRRYEHMHDWQNVKMVIHQPRIDHTDPWECSLEELLAWAQYEATPIAHEALRLLDERKATGEMPPSQLLVPGEKQCTFCKAAANNACPALDKEVGGITGSATDDDFADERKIKQLANGGLGYALSKVGLVEIWARGVRAEVERRLFAGEDVPGYKIVTGKEGNRKWVDPKAAEVALRNVLGDNIHDHKLISPTTAEKKLKKSNPVWAKLQSELVTRAPGRKSVAPVDDKRPAQGPGAPDDDFDDETVDHDALAEQRLGQTQHPFRS
jgi:hypothetical protein